MVAIVIVVVGVAALMLFLVLSDPDALFILND
jgi:hypothetical protein